MIVLALACAPHEAAPAPIALSFAAPTDWSVDEPLIQHHATTAFSSDGVFGVAWTVGALAGAPRIVLATEAGELHDLGRGRSAAKPDLEADGAGRWFAGYQLTVGGIGLDRVDGASIDGLDPAGEETGNSSVDLALHPDGSLLAVWYEEGDPVGRYRGASVGPDFALRPSAFPDPLAEVVDYSPIPPDAAPLADGGALVAWMDQTLTDGGPPDTLLLGRFDVGGAPVWEEVVATTTDEAPRRPTVGVAPDGRSSVVYRRYDPDDLSTAVGWLAAFDADGAAIRADVRLPGVAEQPVLAQLGADGVAVAWSSWDGERWWIAAALYGFPDGALLAGPILASDGAADAFRPHLSAQPTGAGWRLGLSWEQGDPLRIHATTGTASGSWQARARAPEAR